MMEFVADPWKFVSNPSRMLKDTFVGIHMDKQMSELPIVQRCFFFFCPRHLHLNPGVADWRKCCRGCSQAWTPPGWMPTSQATNVSFRPANSTPKVRHLCVFFGHDTLGSGVPLPTLLSRPEECLELIADYVIVMLSDDNISINATVIR